MPVSLPPKAMVQQVRQIRWQQMLRSAVAPLCILFFIVLSGAGLYWRSNTIMQLHLRDYLRTTATISALQIDGDELAKIGVKKGTLDSPAYAKVVAELNAIRSAVPTIRYAYIMGRTKDPMTLEFLADADSLSTEAQLDINHDGKLEDNEVPSFPGDTYDITDVPALQGPAFTEPTVDPTITEDSWGRLISGYAPIRKADGTVVGVLGIDMQADAFESLSQSIFSFDALLIVVLGALLLSAYAAYEMHRRHTEAEKQLESDRSALMDLASHQLGAPLTTFKWWLEILRERDGGKLCRESDVCVQMEEGIKRMDMIIRALRSADVSKLSGKHDQCDIASVLKQAAQEAGPVLSHKSQTCTLQIDENLPAVAVDGALLDGAVEELIENASMYSDNGKTIVVRATRKNDTVLLDVIDEGDGVAPQELPNLMQKFTRGKGAYQRKPVGNGLGLWIVKSIIERAGGKIWIESQLRKGTTVHIILPVAGLT